VNLDRLKVPAQECSPEPALSPEHGDPRVRPGNRLAWVATRLTGQDDPENPGRANAHGHGSVALPGTRFLRVGPHGCCHQPISRLPPTAPCAPLRHASPATGNPSAGLALTQGPAGPGEIQAISSTRIVLHRR
jgi:hypothetical protein